MLVISLLEIDKYTSHLNDSILFSLDRISLSVDPIPHSHLTLRIEYGSAPTGVNFPIQKHRRQSLTKYKNTKPAENYSFHIVATVKHPRIETEKKRKKLIIKERKKKVTRVEISAISPTFVRFFILSFLQSTSSRPFELIGSDDERRVVSGFVVAILTNDPRIS